MVENAASAPPLAPRAERSALAARVLSAIVMIPIALLVIRVGLPWLGIGAALLASGMAWEWARLTHVPTAGPTGIAMVLSAAGSVVIATLVGANAGALCGTLGIVLLGLYWRDRSPALWIWGGLLWIVIPSIGLLYLRDPRHGGWETMFWLCFVVWATDIGAFVVGKLVGGPRLAPRISPQKTWAGFFGGMAAAGIVGWLASSWAIGGNGLTMAVVSAALAIVGQMGDMAESYAKRRFGAKDSSNLIPGHGGLLDRLDGMIAVVALVGLITLVTGGSIVTWR
jgi:phosphatidate cytidylyltransferase